MKKLFLLTIALLTGLSSVTAEDQYWTVDEDQWPGETVVYAQLVPANGDQAFITKAYQVAAFVDGELRAVADMQDISSNNTIIRYFPLRVKGSETDNGKTITFKAFNGASQLEYDLTLDSRVGPIIYTGETSDEAKPSNLLQLNLPVEPTAIALPATITVAKDQTLDLKPLITVTPAGAALPNNLTWDFANSAEWISVEGFTLTGLKAVEGCYLGLSAGSLSAWTTVTVTNPATAISLKSDHTAITVFKDDTQTLTAFLSEAITLTPADATDQVTWSIANPGVVENMAPTAQGFNPKAGGTTTMTAQVLNADGSVRLQASQAVTVTVVVPVEGLTLSRQTMDCNVGDDLTAYLASIVGFNPADATNKSVTWNVDEGDAVVVGNDGKIRAAKAGTASLRVLSEDNSKAVADIRVTVHNPAKDVTFKSATLYYTYTGENMGVASDIVGNIQLLPAGFDNISGLSIASSRPNNVLNIQKAAYGDSGLSLEATVLGVGTATVTVSFTYNDYLAGYQRAATSAVTVSKSFDVTVAQGLAGFTITTGNLVFGQEATVTVTPEPAGSVFDASKVTLIVTNNYQLPLSWTQTVGQGEESDHGVVFSVVPNLPGPVTIGVLYNNQPMEGSQTSATVGMPFSLVSGWQWRSLNYGYAEPGTMEEIFGSDLVEIRSQYELLYNDARYGYFGDLADHGLQQNGCYKIKMQAATETPYIFDEGYFHNSGLELNLNNGWTWTPNPYFYARPLSLLKGSEDDRIVSFADGFAEYAGGRWTGTLTTLRPGQGYLYYHVGEGAKLTFPSEFDMGPAADDAQPAGSRQTGREQSPWQYDAGRFRDVMTIVATVPGMASLSACSVGAFVDGECRGEGRVVDGRLFVSVHGQGGDMVSLRLCDRATGEQLLTAEAIAFKPMAGTLRQPVSLTLSGQATAVGSVRTADSEADTVYTTGGQRRQRLQKGVNIVRAGDGAVRKVLTK